MSKYKQDVIDAVREAISDAKDDQGDVPGTYDEEAIAAIKATEEYTNKAMQSDIFNPKAR